MCDNIIHVHQCALIISLRCTLKCKLCLVYAPYYKHPKDFTLEEVDRSIESFFNLVDSCGSLNIQGGEPLMHKDLSKIIGSVMKYKGQIGRVLLTTNGTLMPSEDVIQVLRENREDIQVNISDYGRGLSKRVPELIDLFDKYEICYKIINYFGEHLHFNGWLDFTDHTYKWKTESDLIENAKECGYRQGGNLAIRQGELYFCYRVARRIELGIIEKNEKSYIDMYSQKSREDKRQNIRDILNAPYTPGCAYCIGKRSDATHHTPAIQLTKEEIEEGVEKYDISR